MKKEIVAVVKKEIRTLHCVEMIDILIKEDMYLYDRRNLTWG